jgi:hypothetical protein
MNKDTLDDNVEEPKFHMAVEIGHYRVIPFPVEYLFYTICTSNQPQYCRDTYMPVLSGESFTVVIDKRPEGIILQLRRGHSIVNIFPHAFFPDSSGMFFKDVTSYTDRNKGDSLKNVLMVGKGFAGVENGIHEFNGKVTSLRIFKYSISNDNTGFELMQVRNQHTDDQRIKYIPVDHLYSSDKFLRMEYQFYPYRLVSGELTPSGEMQTGESDRMPNNKSITFDLSPVNRGLYKVTIQTLDDAGNVLRSTLRPFEIWVYPKEWGFEFY